MSNLLLFLMLKVRRQSISDLIFKLTMPLTSQRLKQQRYHDVMFSALYAISVAAQLSVMIHADRTVGGYKQFVERFLGITIYGGIVSQTFLTLTGPCSFLFPHLIVLCYCYIQLAFKIMVDQMKQDINCLDKCSTKSIEQAGQQYLICNELRVEINNVFGLIPFVYVTHHFLTLTTNIIDVIISTLNYKDGVIVNVLEMDKVFAVVFFSLMALCSGVATDSLERLHSATLAMTRSHNDDVIDRLNAKHTVLLGLIGKPIVKSTAWGVFVLDKAFIMHFLANLIQFTVMIVTTIIQVRNYSVLVAKLN